MLFWFDKLGWDSTFCCIWIRSIRSITIMMMMMMLYSCFRAFLFGVKCLSQVRRHTQIQWLNSTELAAWKTAPFPFFSSFIFFQSRNCQIHVSTVTRKRFIRAMRLFPVWSSFYSIWRDCLWLCGLWAKATLVVHGTFFSSVGIYVTWASTMDILSYPLSLFCISFVDVDAVQFDCGRPFTF